MPPASPSTQAEHGPVSSGYRDGRPRALVTQPKIGVHGFLTPQAEWGDVERGDPLPYSRGRSGICGRRVAAWALAGGRAQGARRPGGEDP
jgi:hypothetical protein